VTKPLLIEPEAQEELEDAALWYEEQRPGLGGRLLVVVSATIDRIRRLPQAGAPVPYIPEDLPARRVAVKGFPYHVVYLITPEAIRVLALAHRRRRPGYWSGRHGT
jgi:plasmid stabilization system protein ParE